MKFAPDFIDKVRDANNIVDIISQYTEFKRTGSNLMARCPFPDHIEKTPSFSVSEDKQVYHCFGCKKSGNIFNFLQTYNGMGFGESIEYLAKRASIPLPISEYRNQSKEVDKNKFYKLNLHAGSFYKKKLQSLPANHEVKQYLEKRGLRPETLETFKIGYAPSEWSELASYLEMMKAPLSDAEKLGLIKKRQSGAGYFDMFRDRIMFPILSAQGDVIGFGGRIVNQGQPKYLNSSESVVFHKGRTLYGIFETAKFIRTEDQVIVVEGYMDMIALYQAGIKNVVATLGTALTVDHARIIKRLTNNVVVLFDGDEAGQEAQERSLPILLQEGLLPRGLALPDQMDPDEYILKNGVESFKKLIQNSQDLFLFIFAKHLKDYRATPTEQEKRLNLIAPLLNSVKSDSLRELYIQKVSDLMGVTAQWVIKGIRNRTSAQPKIMPISEDFTDEIQEDLIEIKNVNKEEQIILNLALSNQAILDEVLDSGILHDFASSSIAKLFEIIQTEYRHKGTFFDKLTSILCSKVTDPGAVTGYLEKEFFQGVDPLKLKNDCFQRVRDRALKLKANQLINELKVNQDPEKLEQFMNVMKGRQALKDK